MFFWGSKSFWHLLIKLGISIFIPLENLQFDICQNDWKKYLILSFELPNTFIMKVWATWLNLLKSTWCFLGDHSFYDDRATFLANKNPINSSANCTKVIIFHLQSVKLEETGINRSCWLFPSRSLTFWNDQNSRKSRFHLKF